MRQIVLVLFFISCAYAQDDFGSTGVRVAIKIYDDCSKSNDFMRCLKMKAVTLIERFGRMDSLALANGVVVMRTPDAPKDEPELTKEQIDKTLERSSDAKDATLNKLLMEKISHFIGSRSIQVTLPKISVSKLIEEGNQKYRFTLTLWKSAFLFFPNLFKTSGNRGREVTFFDNVLSAIRF